MGKDVDYKKRKFLLSATGVMGAIAGALAVFPFMSSLMPNRKARALGEPIKVNVGQMKPGQQLTVMWRGKPIWIVRRSEEELKTLSLTIPDLRDPNSKIPQQPDYAQNQFRSRKPEFLVLVGICTHLGCVPTFRPEPKSIDPKWEGGFFCSCHGSKFDLAGRVYKGVPAPINLEVPPYAFIGDDVIIIGVDKV